MRTHKLALAVRQQICIYYSTSNQYRNKSSQMLKELESKFPTLATSPQPAEELMACDPQVVICYQSVVPRRGRIAHVRVVLVGRELVRPGCVNSSTKVRYVKRAYQVR